jgi:intracellular multiplication protein IcmK
MMLRPLVIAAIALLGPAGAHAQQVVSAAANVPVVAATGTAPAAQPAQQPMPAQVSNGPPTDGQAGSAGDGGGSQGAPAPAGPAAPGSGAGYGNAASGARYTNSVPTPGMPLPSPLVVRPDPVTQAVDQVAPLTPDQVKAVRKALGERDKAIYTTESVPKTASQLLTLDMSPNAQRPVVRVAPNIGGTVSFIDMAGNAWPIVHVDNFGAKGYTVSLPSENTVAVWSVNPYVTGNVAVYLKGLASPQSFIVQPATTVANDRTDLIIPRVLPDKRDAYLGSGRADTLGGYSDELTPYLLRTPPDNAKALRVTGLADSQAWQTPDGSLILRTPASVRSPAWTRSGSAADGTHVYKLQITPLVTVAQTDGRLTYVQISGYDSVSRLSPVSAIQGGMGK